MLRQLSLFHSIGLTHNFKVQPPVKFPQYRASFNSEFRSSFILYQALSQKYRRLPKITTTRKQRPPESNFKKYCPLINPESSDPPKVASLPQLLRKQYIFFHLIAKRTLGPLNLIEGSYKIIIIFFINNIFFQLRHIRRNVSSNLN